MFIFRGRIPHFRCRFMCRAPSFSSGCGEPCSQFPMAPPPPMGRLRGKWRRKTEEGACLRGQSAMRWAATPFPFSSPAIASSARTAVSQAMPGASPGRQASLRWSDPACCRPLRNCPPSAQIPRLHRQRCDWTPFFQLVRPRSYFDSCGSRCESAGCFLLPKKIHLFYASVTDETVYKRYTFNIDGIVYIYKLPAVPFGGGREECP